MHIIVSYQVSTWHNKKSHCDKMRLELLKMMEILSVNMHDGLKYQGDKCIENRMENNKHYMTAVRSAI